MQSKNKNSMNYDVIMNNRKSALPWLFVKRFFMFTMDLGNERGNIRSNLYTIYEKCMGRYKRIKALEYGINTPVNLNRLKVHKRINR